MTIAGYYIIGIIGSRAFKNRALVRRKLTETLDQRFRQNTAFISGGAVGPDTWAKEWGEAIGPRRSFFLEALPIRAGETDNYFLRNSVIAELADELVAFIAKGRLRSGAWNTINHFRKLGKTNYIVFDEDGNRWDRMWRD